MCRPLLADGKVFETISKFTMRYSARAVRGIRITPDSNWFNRDLLTRYASQLPTLWNHNGTMPLLPHTVYVAYKPRVELIVSKKDFYHFKNELDNPNVLSWFVAGSKFATSTEKELADAEGKEVMASDVIKFDEIMPIEGNATTTANGTEASTNSNKKSNKKNKKSSKKKSDKKKSQKVNVLQGNVELSETAQTCSYIEYYNRRPDVRRANMDAMDHYVRHGHREGMCAPSNQNPVCKIYNQQNNY